MSVKKYAVFFLFIFSLFLAAPSIMSIIEKPADISCFFEASEEEKEETETKENTLVFTLHAEKHNGLHGLFRSLDNYCHTSKTYAEVILDKTLPPPES